MVSHRSKALRRHPSLLQPVFVRASWEGIVDLRNPASSDLVRERDDHVFGEHTRATTGSDYFPNDDDFPDIGNLFINDLADGANGSAPAAQYAIQSSLFTIML